MRRLGLIAALVAVLSLGSVEAQGPILPGPGLPVASGASPTWTGTTAAANGSCGFTSPCTISSSVTVPAGFISAVAGIVEGGSASSTITSLTVCGTSLTLDKSDTIPSGNAGTANFHGTTAGGTCSVSVANSSGNISAGGVGLGLLSNLNSTTPGTTCGSQFPSNTASPYPCSGGLTVASGGFGITGIATANATLPTSGGSGLVVDATAANSGGQTFNIGIGHVTASFATGANVWAATTFCDCGVVGEPFR